MCNPPTVVVESGPRAVDVAVAYADLIAALQEFALDPGITHTGAGYVVDVQLGPGDELHEGHWSVWIGGYPEPLLYSPRSESQGWTVTFYVDDGSEAISTLYFIGSDPANCAWNKQGPLNGSGLAEQLGPLLTRMKRPAGTHTNHQGGDHRVTRDHQQ